MKKTLLTFVMLLACIATTFANEVVFDFTQPEALTPSITPSPEASTGVDLDATPFTNGGVSFSINSEAANPVARIWTNSASKNFSKEMRAYKNSVFTVKAPGTITSIVFKGKKVTGMSAVEGTFAEGSWTGASSNVTLNVTATLNVETVTVVYSEGGVDPTPDPQPQPESNVVFEEAFATGNGEFTIDNKVKPDSIESIWNHDTYKGNSYMKATAFKKSLGGADAEGWLVSPVIDLTKATDCALSFDQATNFFKGFKGTAVKVKAEGGEWADLAIENAPTSDSWNFVTSTADLKAFDGKKIQIAFVYTSVVATTGTWEVNNVKVTAGKGGEVKPEPQPEPEVTVYTTIADLKANAAQAGADVVYEFQNLLVTAKAKDNIYVADEKESVLFYGSKNDFKVGDRISGKIKANLVSFYGLTELKNVDYTEVKVVSQGNEVVPMELTLAELSKEGAFKMYESMLVVVKGVKVSETAFNAKSRTVPMTDGVNSVDLRDEMRSATDYVFSTEKTYSFVGVVGQYHDKAQLNLLSLEGIMDGTATGIEAVEGENGAQVIYDLSGRRVAKAVKGLYIVNGKKVYVK